MKRDRNRVCRRQELANNWRKDFEVLNGIFCHPLEKHSMCFHACAVLVQVSINHGSRLWDCSEYWQRVFPVNYGAEEVGSMPKDDAAANAAAEAGANMDDDDDGLDVQKIAL